MVWMVGLFIKTLKHFSERSSSAARLLTCLPEVLPSFFGIWAKFQVATNSPVNQRASFTVENPGINDQHWWNLFEGHWAFNKDLPNESARTIESQYLKPLKIQSEFQSLYQLLVARSTRDQQTHPGFRGWPFLDLSVYFYQIYRGHGNWYNGYSRSLADTTDWNHVKNGLFNWWNLFFPSKNKVYIFFVGDKQVLARIFSKLLDIQSKGLVKYDHLGYWLLDLLKVRSLAMFGLVFCCQGQWKLSWIY